VWPLGWPLSLAVGIADMKALFIFLVFGLAIGELNSDIEALINQFLPYPSADVTRESLFNITSIPHMAGTIGMEIDVVNWLADQYRGLGFTTYIQEFPGLVTYPGNREVQMTFPVGFNLSLQEPPIESDPTSSNPDAVPTFNAYSAPGDVTGQLVYVNFGSPDDYAYLDSLNINLTGKIAIARYGQNFRGLKVYGAQIRGAAGVLIYSDPQQDGYTMGPVYPEGPYRPEQSVQRGSTQYTWICPGDPQRTLECLGNNNATNVGTLMPSIPVQPISWGDAYPLLINLGGPIAQPGWQGGLNFTYHIGPGPATVRMYIESEYVVANMSNILAVIPGTEVPDEKVIMGGHVDAWVFGAVDPNSGTVSLLEAARGLSQLMAKNNWKPKRTLIFAGWDGEEFGLIGSTYFAENANTANDPTKTDLSKVVSYVNWDTPFTGTEFVANGSPSLRSILEEVTELITDPATELPLDEAWNMTGGNLGVLGAGSDYVTFLDKFGVPSLHLGFNGYAGTYPVYHSIYDSYTWIENWGDPNFTYHQTAAQLAGSLMIALSDSNVIPLDYLDTASALNDYLDQTYTLMRSMYQGDPVNLTQLNVSVANFANAVFSSQNTVSSANTSTASSNKDVNAWLASIERLFLNSDGLPNRPFYKHTVQAPAIDNGYGPQIFPGVYEFIEEGNFTVAQQQVTVLASRIDRASDALNNPPSGSSSSDNTTLIVAIVVPLVVVLLLIIGFVLWKKRQSENKVILTDYESMKE